MPKDKFSLSGYDEQHYRQTIGYTRAIDKVYKAALNDFAVLGSSLKLDPSKPFSFVQHPMAYKKAKKILSTLASNIQVIVLTGSRAEWNYACVKNEAFINHIFDTSKIAKETLAKYNDRNLDALSSFQNRKINGLGLSKRVWNIVAQFEKQIELGLDIAIGEGKSAQQLSRDLRSYLNDPDKLFRRVRDKHGNLVLSKNAKAFHPGQGKYRSSYKNAMRLARTEINMSYREADWLRWQALDFVVGFEVKVSNKHATFLIEWDKTNKGKVEICDQLKGKYPKWFKFVGWHPHCMCFAVPVLISDKDYNTGELNELRAAIRGTQYNKFTSTNTVQEVPKGLTQWVNDNAERSQLWKSQPYFIRDNFVGGVIEGGLIN